MDIKIKVKDIIIETDRLILREFKETDLNDFFEYASVDGVGEMAGWNHHETIEISKMILNEFISKSECFAIVLKENNKVVGSLGLHYSWANDEGKYKDLKLKEIGYALAKDYWGLGLMLEAVKALINYCFKNLYLDALTCGHFQINNQSKKVIEKCDFKFVKDSEYYSNQMQKKFLDKKYILFKTEK